MDAETLAVALGLVRSMPDGAAEYAAAAEAAAQEAQTAAQSVTPTATLEEIKAYLGIE